MSASSNDLAGFVVAWNISGSPRYEQVKDSLRNAGLKEEYAKELSNRNGFSRVCKQLKKERAIDKVEEKDGKIVFQFTRRHLEEAKKEFKYDYECRLTLDITTGEIECRENEVLRQYAERKLSECLAVRTSQDITRLLQRMFAENADLFPLVPAKGVAYFVPIRHRLFSARVSMFLRSIGGELYHWPVPKGTMNGDRAVRDAINRGLTEMIETVTKKSSEWSDSTRMTTMEKHWKNGT